MSIQIQNPIDSVAKRKHKDYLTPKVFSRLITLSPSLFSSIFTSLDIIFIYIFYRSSGKWDDMTSKTNIDFPRLQIATADDPEKALHISFVMLFSLVFFMQYPVRVFMLRHQRNTSLRQRKSRVYGFLYTLAGVFHLIFTLQTIFGIVSSSFVSGDVNEDYKLDKETITVVFYSFFHTGFTFYAAVWLFEDILIFLGHPEQLNTLLMVILRFVMLNIFIISEVFWVVMISMGNNFRTSKFLGCNKDTFYAINQLVFLVGLVFFLISISINTAFLGILECLRYSPCLNKDREMTIQLLDDIELESNRDYFHRKYRKRRVQRGVSKRMKNGKVVYSKIMDSGLESSSVGLNITQKIILYDEHNIIMGASTLEEEEEEEEGEEEGIMPPGVYSTEEEFEYRVKDRDFHGDHCSTCTSADEEIYEVKSDNEEEKKKKNNNNTAQQNQKQEGGVNKKNKNNDDDNLLILMYDGDDNGTVVYADGEEEDDQRKESNEKKSILGK